MSTRCQEEIHQRGNLPELVLSLCHERRSISTVLLSNRGIGRPALSPFRGCNVGKNQSECLRSRLPNGVAVYRSVLRGCRENKCCQPWRAQVLRARCLVKINGREKSKLGRSPAISSFYDERNADPGTDTASGSSNAPCNPRVLPFVAGGRSVQN